MQPDEILKLLLQYDECPPDEDFSPFRYGQTVGADASETKVVGIVSGALHELPSALASSFLEGVLSVRRYDSARNTLLASIADVNEVTAVGNIVELLQGTFEMNEHEVFAEVSERLRAAQSANAKLRLCYAIWALVCRESYDVESGMASKPSAVERGEIEALVSDVDLPASSRSILMECVAALDHDMDT